MRFYWLHMVSYTNKGLWSLFGSNLFGKHGCKGLGSLGSNTADVAAMWRALFVEAGALCWPLEHWEGDSRPLPHSNTESFIHIGKGRNKQEVFPDQGFTAILFQHTKVDLGGGVKGKVRWRVDIWLTEYHTFTFWSWVNAGLDTHKWRMKISLNVNLLSVISTTKKT